MMTGGPDGSDRSIPREPAAPRRGFRVARPFRTDDVAQAPAADPTPRGGREPSA